MNFDDVLQYIGEFGLYQKRVYFLLCLFCIFHGMRMVVMVFTLYQPKHRCAIPGYLNDTFDVTSLEHLMAVNSSIPSGDSCHIYQPGNYTYDADNRPINASLEKCTRWVYDESVFVSTVTGQLDLVCDDSTKRSHAAMVFYGGFLIGTFLLGTISDYFGRKICLYLSLTLVVIFGTGLVFTKSFIAFTVVNFFLGAAVPGMFPSAFVIGIELVAPAKRTYTASIIQLFFSTGVVILSGLAFLIRDWHYLLVAITAPLVLFYLMWCLIPESPRWQIQKGRYEKARQTVLQAAKVNKKEVPSEILDAVMPVDEDEESIALYDLEKNEREREKKAAEVKEKGRLIDVFKSPVLFVRTSIIFFNWFVISMTFYGLNFNIGNLVGASMFLNFFISGLVEFPAYLLPMFTVDRFGRKAVHFGMLISSGVACLGCVFSIIFASDYPWITITLAMIGKFGASGAFSTVYMYSSEIFPTVIRNSALGMSSSWGRVGAMFAPYVAAMGAKAEGELGRSVPLLVCGCLVICAGMLSCFLPETWGRKLPETVNDAKNFTKIVKENSLLTKVNTDTDNSETSLAIENCC
ncbi:organic cation transporter protein-like [Physella acuta]|uniref:organic cation transporter protein-like n=1 Tax=Physella acuta TaxID=109671 RepID=UPI0027DB04BC|nr:organic cation transporter protein-like [Physella acuta]